MAAHRPTPFIRLMAWLAPATAGPSAIWRLATLAGVYGPRHPVTQAMRSELIDVLIVSFGSVALLSLTIGLVQPWGVQFPKWLPFIGRKPVPRMLALVPAFAAGLLLTALSLYVLLGVSKHQGEGAVQLTGGSLLLVQLCYAPLLLAGPIVLVVANDYRRRAAR